ncbi:hypothetical protein [Methylocella silvestris]|nr:hypothetical protein [Methylocella silvestris]
MSLKAILHIHPGLDAGRRYSVLGLQPGHAVAGVVAVELVSVILTRGGF